MNGVRFCAVVPAAGASTRMGGGRPKQYLPLAGRTVIEWALAALLDHAGLECVAVALPADDDTFASFAVAGDPRVRTVRGGATRAASVRAALGALSGHDADLPVLVHDAARPCLLRSDLDRLLAAMNGETGGALLAVPVRDTLKRATADGRIASTVARDGLWQALTPQGFRLGALGAALRAAADDVTDEASAMERRGHSPRLVEGDPSNIKITRPGDLPLAAAILGARGGRASP